MKGNLDESSSVLKKASGESRPRRKYGKTDAEFMNSLSNAMLAGSSSRLNILLYVICLVMISVITWAYFAELDERTRGVGRVIPSRQIQVVQNLEGGIIKEIHVVEGEIVTAGQILVTIDDTGLGSSFAESFAKINELVAKSSRLRAEAGITETLVPVEGDSQMAKLMANETRLFATQLSQYNNQKSVLQQQLEQRKVELLEARQDLKSLRLSREMVDREIELSRPLRQKQLLSELEFLQLEQRALEKKQEVDKTEKKLEKLELQIVEAKQKIQELDFARRAKAMEELNAVMAEIDQLSVMQVAIKDRVSRTAVRSPVDGIVKQLLINTVGGVVRPGMDILAIVPNDKSLLVEAKVKPADIAFMYPGQKAVLKFTAYDFAIYGGLEGEVTHISADTITDEKREEFYLVRVKTEQSYLGTEENKKNIIVGMTAQVDIITGKKTVMQYLMKPILRAKYNALHER
jgi:adhesin transport system membrane fusion protein